MERLGSAEMIYGIIIFLLTLTVDLWTDYRLWIKYRNVNRPKGSVNHLVGLALRTAALVLCVIFMGWWSIPMLLFAYWILFDGIFNVITGQLWFRTWVLPQKPSAWLDRMQHEYPVLVWVKYIGAIGSIILYIYAN